jgi:hypothetical protein
MDQDGWFQPFAGGTACSIRRFMTPETGLVLVALLSATCIRREPANSPAAARKVISCTGYRRAKRSLRKRRYSRPSNVASRVA